MTPFERYLSDLHSIHASGTGVKETSYYPPLTNLFDSVGRLLKPRVHSILNPKNKGAGIPDIGFYTATQLKRGELTPNQATNPERGAVEAKGTAQNIEKLAQSAQVKKYLTHYGLVLVTNLREFLLLEADEQGQPIYRERYAVGASEAEFWQLAAPEQREATVAAHGARLTEFLRRVLLYKAPITAPDELARFLASYAREGLFRLEQSADLPALDQLRQAMEQALGNRFVGEKGEHFFRSTLVQTLFYGVFSAWVLWSRTAPAGAVFDWRAAAWSLHVPMIKSLFEDLSKPSTLQPLGLDEVLDWTAAVLNRVKRAVFFKRFEEAYAVQYFYEPFLEAYDPALRRELGVWYTPPEIVTYMVERVDRVLREELGLPDGLADPSVYVLDPACGTGAYLVEVVRRIARTYDEQGADALTRQDLKKAVRERLFGFELMPAPFVVAHLQLGLLLQELGAPLDFKTDAKKKTAERAAVYLTNSLTGWEEHDALPPLTGQLYPDLKAEHDAARDVKRQKPILVVLGNPPYNAYAGTSPAEENGLVDIYKQGLIEEWGIKKFNLDELYVRFFRIAERRVAEGTGQGVVSFVTNFSYLRSKSFVVMRRHLLGNFDRLWFDNLNGDSRETGKTTPTGEPDPSVFSTPQNPAGIRKGTAVGLLVRRAPVAGTAPAAPLVRYREFWGKGKREALVASLTVPNFNAQYQVMDPTARDWFTFRAGAAPEEEEINADTGLPDASATDQYRTWPTLVELAAQLPLNGPVERRGLSLIAHEREVLEERMSAYFDPAVTDERVAEISAPLMMTGNRIAGPEARKKLQSETAYNPNVITRYPFKPFDNRWCYLANIRPLFSEPSPSLLKLQDVPGNSFLISRDSADKSKEGVPFTMSSLVSDYDSLSGHARHFPVLLTRESIATPLFGAAEPQITANISARVRAYLTALGLTDLDQLPTAGLPWYHALAVGYSPRYRARHAADLPHDWPRIPLPATAADLRQSAALGERVAALLAADAPLIGVSHSPVKALQPFGKLTVAAPATTADLALTVGWGSGGHGKPVMPGTGRVSSRPYTDAERDALDALFADAGLPPAAGYALLGDTALDVYLNDTTYWTGIPARVWEFTIGGYQVLKKWLSYREQPILTRPLTPEEARYVPQVVRRLLALLLLAPALDASYEAAAADAWAWAPHGE